jgi:hypothetical protein
MGHCWKYVLEAIIKLYYSYFCVHNCWVRRARTPRVWSLPFCCSAVRSKRLTDIANYKHTRRFTQVQASRRLRTLLLACMIVLLVGEGGLQSSQSIVDVRWMELAILLILSRWLGRGPPFIAQGGTKVASQRTLSYLFPGEFEEQVACHGMMVVARRQGTIKYDLLPRSWSFPRHFWDPGICPKLPLYADLGLASFHKR